MRHNLSELQQKILRLALAYRNQPRPEEWRSSKRCDLYQSDIVLCLYSLRPKSANWPDDNWPGRDRTGLPSAKFSLSEPGYNTVRAVISRALARLEKRGLIMIVSKRDYAFLGSAGFELTPTGIEEAESLTVKTKDTTQVS